MSRQAYPQSTIGMKIERVLQMTIDEVVVRGCQEASKWWDRLAVLNAPVSPSERNARWIDGVQGRPGENNHHKATIVPDNFWERFPIRFFEGAAHAGITFPLLERIPDSRSQIISAAAGICQGRFDLLGYHGLDFGDPIDWHLDPLSGRRAPLVHWSRINPLDPAVVGDSKIVWELNRHQWLLLLGQAYRTTGDERYAEAFARFIGEWIKANPVGMGINWASSLEVAFRLISWCWALLLFEGCRALSTSLLGDMLTGIRAHARHLERYLSLYFSPNTHLTGEALGLFYAGVLFPEMSHARRWRARGQEILVQQCERHILPDGVYFEQSTCYQRYTAEIYLHFLILAIQNGIEVPNTVASRLQQLLDFLMAVRRPDGSMPQIGDADGGWLLPLIARASDDLRGVFSVAAAFFGRGDYAWVAGSLTPELLWLLGLRGVQAFEALTPAPPEKSLLRLFPHGGYVVMRSGWEQDAHQLIFDAGPLGSDAHGHADLLSIQCSLFGEPYLADPGTYCYTTHPEWRTYFRSTAVHSTVVVDGCEQADPAGPFKWKMRPRARLRCWRSTEAFDFADAEHDAYAGLPDPVTHRRRVLFVKPRFWVIVDDLEGKADHQIEIRFQFAPIEVTVGRNLWTRARGTGGHGLFIRSFATVPLEASVHQGERSPIQGWGSPAYGQRQAAPAVVYSAQPRLPVRILTLILPTRNPLAPPAEVFPLFGEMCGPTGLVFGDDEAVTFTEDNIIIKSGREAYEIG